MGHLPPTAGGGQLEDWRRQRVAQMRRMTDQEFLAELRRHQASPWRQPKLLEHVKKHRADLKEFFGPTLAPSECERLSLEILRSPDRVFTELRPGGAVTYFFIRLHGDRGIIIVATRGGFIRTMLPAEEFMKWLGRHPAVIEVTERAKGLGL